MRRWASARSASRSPKTSASPGQVVAQAGFFPRAIRSEQKVHLRMYETRVPHSNFGTSNGHATMQ